MMSYEKARDQAQEGLEAAYFACANLAAHLVYAGAPGVAKAASDATAELFKLVLLVGSYLPRELPDKPPAASQGAAPADARLRSVAGGLDGGAGA